MPYCVHCGKPMADDHRLCGNCGASKNDPSTGFEFHPEVIENAQFTTPRPQRPVRKPKSRNER